MKTRHLGLGVSLLAAAWLTWFGDKSPATAVVQPIEHSRSADAPAGPGATSAQTAARAIGKLRARDELIGNASGPADMLFGVQSWTPPPPPPIKVNAGPPPKPVAPPLPFTYLGKKLENGTWEAYLARGNDTYVVREQNMIDKMYRAESIRPPTLTITYLPLKQIQTLTIGEAD
ncbi:MAG: hypothetical protein JWQ10_2703 [Herbaspirillum sp.]|nr:hypothetical protein [Herbaspirillum sp.]